MQPAAAQGAWYRIDLHMHTPGSADYEQPGVTFLDILKQGERRGLDIMAFTDHNTVNGCRQMMREIADLELLERLERIKPDEMGRLMEYRRLLKKILVLPGFEFSSTFGFHILGIFPPEKPLRDIEYLLVQMHVPGETLDQGLTEAGATSDVLTAYRLIDEAGGMAIAAHANSSSGVLMRGVNIGGQTRIAFTQDTHLAAVELTDLSKGRRSMAYWLSGTKAEYPRRMHIIQGSDAHRLTTSMTEARRLGIGERTTEVLLPELSFDALRSLFHSQDFHRVRPARTPLNLTIDTIKDVRAQGEGPTLAFHPALPKRGNRFDAVIYDVCAMSNGEGGVIIIGCEPAVTKKPQGVAGAEDAAIKLSEAIHERLAPPLPVVVKVRPLGDVDVIEVTVPRSDQAPHAIDGNQFYVRVGTESRLATRDEIVEVTRRTIEAAAAKEAQISRHRDRDRDRDRDRGQGGQTHPRPEPSHRPQQPQQQRHPSQPPSQPQPQPQPQPQSQPQSQPPSQPPSQPQPQPHSRQRPPGQPQQQRRRPEQPQPAAPDASATAPSGPAATADTEAPPEAVQTHPQGPAAQPTTSTPPLIEGMPRSGVHIAAVDEREGIRYYTVRDLRNNMLVRNVTVKSARDLWHYAIVQYNTTAYRTDNLDWRVGADGIGRFILNKAHRAGKMRYDIALRSRDGAAYIFYGVAEDGMDAVWRGLVAEHAQSAVGASGPTTPAPGEAQPDVATSPAEKSADAMTAGADS